MSLPIFNLATTIEIYNKEHHTHYAPYEDFGFAYLASDMLLQTNAAITGVNEGLNRYHLAAEEREALKKRKRFYQFYKSHLDSQYPLRPVPLSEDERTNLDAANQKIQYWGWANKWTAKLAQPETWQAWIENAPPVDKARLSELERQWEECAAFTCHSNESLYAAAKKILPSLTAHHKRARRQRFISFWMLPQAISRTYVDYVDSFLQAAKQMHAKVAIAMLWRLKAFDQNPATEGNHIIHWYQELHKIGVVPKAEISLEQRESLTAKQFHFFHHYIERYGDAETKEQLKTLSWFSKVGSSCLTCPVATASGLSLVPVEFAKEIPWRLKKPAWLYRGHNLRHTFFQTKGLLLISLKNFPDLEHVEVNLQDLSNAHGYLTTLQYKQQEIQQALKEVRQPTYKIGGYFQRHAKRFIQKWQAYLDNYQHKILEAKLQIAEKMAVQLQRCDSMDATRNAWSACCFVRKLLKTLREELNSCSNLLLKARLVQVEMSLVTTLSNYRVLKVMRAIADGKIMSQEKLDYLRDVTQSIFLYDKKMYSAFQELCCPQFIQMRALFDEALKVNQHTAHYTQAHVDRTLLLNTTLAQYGDEPIKQAQTQRVANKLPKYFLRYLEFLLGCGKSGEHYNHHQQAIEAMEHVIQALGCDIAFANKTLRVHAQDLQNLRQKALNKQGSWLLVYARAKALAQGMLSDCLEKRIHKDVITFDKQLFDFIRTDVELNLNDSTLCEIRKISDQHIEQQAATLHDLSVAPEQKTIVGLAGGSTAYIRELLELRKQVHQKKQHLLVSPHSLHEHSHLINALAVDLKNQLQQNSQPLAQTFIGFTASGRHPLFTKTYFNTQLFPTENKPTTPKSISI